MSSIPAAGTATARDRKSTRLNSSHQIISYAVFCLKKNTDVSGSAASGSGRAARPEACYYARASPALDPAPPRPATPPLLERPSASEVFFLNDRGTREVNPFPQPAALPP